ncbi:MAG TPA: DNA replication/repair protein RecF [Actinomycetota bacterium]|nr:DNA replication/repair protein RecF [Actinomycetota bacterium]
MRLLWIEARDFRNHTETALEVPPALTAVVGPNGQGKTNLLEAIFYLCSLESPRVRADLPLVRAGASSAFLRGEVESAGGRVLIEVEVRASGQNRVQVNRSPVRRKRDVRRQARAVFSGPDDLAIVAGEPDERRRFLDESVRALWPLKESLMTAYERTLRQRNRLLKDWEGSGPPPGLEGWDEELVATGSALTRARAEAVDAVAPRASAGFATLSGDSSETLAVAYRPSVEGAGVEDAFRERLRERRGDEIVRRTTLVGPHRDDLGLSVQGLQARGFASHGEGWGAALCLRIALAGAVGDEIGEPAVTLLDDPFSALDPERRHRVAESLDGRGQLLIAVPDDAQIPPGATVWRVKEGRVAPD